MKTATILLTLALTAAAALAADTPPATTTTAPATTSTAPAADTTPAALFKEAIALLEAGKNREAIERLMEPSLLAEAKEKPGQFDKLLEGFAGRKAASLLSVLKQVQSITPTYNEDGTIATFDPNPQPPAEGAPTRPAGRGFKLIKIADKWYIQGR